MKKHFINRIVPIIFAAFWGLLDASPAMAGVLLCTSVTAADNALRRPTTSLGCEQKLPGCLETAQILKLPRDRLVIEKKILPSTLTWAPNPFIEEMSERSWAQKPSLKVPLKLVLAPNPFLKESLERLWARNPFIEKMSERPWARNPFAGEPSDRAWAKNPFQLVLSEVMWAKNPF